jgi:hypothetical protein
MGCYQLQLGMIQGSGSSGIRLFRTVIRTGGHTSFQRLLGYEGYRAKQEEDGEWSLYVEDHVPVHRAKKALVEAKRVLQILLRKRPLKCVTHIKKTYQTTV